MSDITKCDGIGCDLKEQCLRFTANTNQDYQSWFIESPKEGEECKYFWDVKE